MLLKDSHSALISQLNDIQDSVDEQLGDDMDGDDFDMDLFQ